MADPALTDVHAWPLIIIVAVTVGALLGVFAVKTGPSDFMRCLDRADTVPGEAACAQRFPQERP